MMEGAPPHRDELLRVVRTVRIRWRWKVALRSLTVLLGAGVLTLLAAAAGLEWFRFSPSAIIAFRVVTYVVLVALGWAAFVRPLARHVTDQQVALYLEEHEPTLDAVLLSAVDAGGTGSAPGRQNASAALLERLIASAIERCRQVDLGRGIERRVTRRLSIALAGIGLAAALIFVTGPAFLRQGAAALLLPTLGVEAASPYRIDVTPGNATVARGADVEVVARLSGFTSVEVDLYTRTSAEAPFERGSLIASATSGVFEGHLFALRESTDYFVQAAGVRSAVFRLEVADLPRVDGIEMEYVFPAYTGLPPQTVEPGGDIAALRGTTVRLRVHASLPTAGGRIVGDDREERALTRLEDGTLSGAIEVAKNGIYRIDLMSPAGAFVPASPTYTIDVLADREPAVSLSKPARDLKPTSIEEVFVEARAEDDFGVRQLDLVYSVNGGPEQTLPLVAPRSSPLKELTAGHTFYLEELKLQPGDVVSYYARATDNDAVQGAKSVSSDIFFLEIRPFRKDYRAAESQATAAAQAGAASGSTNDPSALSGQQRRIISGTFNVLRDRAKMTADKFREDVVFLTLAQGQLRQRVEALAAQMNVRLDPGVTSMQQVAQWLGDAVKAMSAAEQKLQARDPKQALPPEQQALGSLLRAEEAYRDVRVAMSNERGGGGAGGRQGSPEAEDLADLFQLEMDKLRNQYETFQRAQQQTAENQVDEMLERLKELARRQEQEAERQRQFAANRQTGGGATAARQRQLADDTEEAARRLDRLSRDDGRPDLADAARQLRGAADAMRRAASRGDASAFAEASAAADRLNSARDRLQQRRTDRLAGAIESALSRVRRLAEEQKGIEGEVRALPQDGADRRSRAGRLLERKDAQATEVADLEKQLDRTAADFRKERPEAARELQQSADIIRDSRLKEKIDYSKGLVQGAPPDSAAGFEEQISSDIASVESHLRDAAGAVGATERDASAEALERARALVRSAETMDQRMRERRGQPGDDAGPQERGGGQEQQGRAGGRGEAGQRDRAGQGGERGGASTGAPQGSGGGARRPGAFGPEDARQFQREARERREEAQQLRRELQSLGVGAADLDQLIRDLQALDNARVYTDPDEALRLQSQLVEGLRRFEFDLRRALGDAAADQIFLSGADQVPAEYRKIVEDYYRALARSRKR